MKIPRRRGGRRTHNLVLRGLVRKPEQQQSERRKKYKLKAQIGAHEHVLKTCVKL